MNAISPAVSPVVPVTFPAAGRVPTATPTGYRTSANWRATIAMRMGSPTNAIRTAPAMGCLTIASRTATTMRFLMTARLPAARGWTAMTTAFPTSARRECWPSTITSLTGFSIQPGASPSRMRSTGCPRNPGRGWRSRASRPTRRMRGRM